MFGGSIIVRDSGSGPRRSPDDVMGAVEATPPVRVAVVDDQPSFRHAAVAVVELADGFAMIAEAESGEAALELVSRSASAQMILIDVNMPGMGGLRAAQQLRQFHPHLMVVLVSTYDNFDLPNSVRLSGLPYLSKQLLTPEALAELWHSPVEVARRMNVPIESGPIEWAPIE